MNGEKNILPPYRGPQRSSYIETDPCAGGEKGGDGAVPLWRGGPGTGAPKQRSALCPRTLVENGQQQLLVLSVSAYQGPGGPPSPATVAVCARARAQFAQAPYGDGYGSGMEIPLERPQARM